MYVSDDLRERMRQHTTLNWSQIAATAIEAAIQIDIMKTTNFEESQIARLRASRGKLTDQVQAEGHEAGARWALEDAEFDELQRVTELDTSDFLDPDLDTLGELGRAIAGDQALLAVELEGILRMIGGAEHYRVLGFVEGAQEVYTKVQAG